MWTGELGWWHYRDGNYQKAVELLSDASQQRPRDTEVSLELAWAQIEIRRYGDALQVVQNTGYAVGIEPEKAMVRAVARWQAQEPDQALVDFNVALVGEPEWGNSSWVEALHSPLVAQSIQGMQAEREQRKQKTRIAAVR
jgi:hypothetical protein